jgi:N-acetylmuramoyl-L-alanine amidase
MVESRLISDTHARMRGTVASTGALFASRCLAAAACLFAYPALATDVKSMHVTDSSEATRVTFDLSGPADYKLFHIANPDRVVIDLHACAFLPGFTSTAGDGGLLKAVRTGQRDKGDSRVVLDLESGVNPKSFLMSPGKGKGEGDYRLVVDLYKKGKSGNQVVKSVKSIEIKPRNVVVAIDPGHGGVDPGATGSSGTHEKEITLAVARELKRLIDKQDGMSAVLTRDGDYFIPLQERFQKARAAKADLFVSIHADAYNSGDARGSSVWMLSSRGATSEAARWLADRENRADLVGGVSLGSKDNTLAAVLLDLSQGATLEASGVVADQVLKSLSRIGPTHRGYVEKANFVVLRSPDVPSILVETAFITNPSEERKLTNPAQREKLARAILDGVRNYFRNAPPPGSWFAVNARKDKPKLASRPSRADDEIESDDDSRVARAPNS